MNNETVNSTPPLLSATAEPEVIAGVCGKLLDEYSHADDYKGGFFLCIKSKKIIHFSQAAKWN